MKTSKFIEEVEKIGYEVKEFTRGIDVVDGVGRILCYISKHESCSMDTDNENFNNLRSKEKSSLFGLVAEYATTPISEREETEKYYLILPNESKDNNQCLNINVISQEYTFNSKYEGSIWNTKFTQEEIDKLPYQDFIQSLIKEEVDED